MTGSGGLTSQNQTYDVSPEWAKRAWVDEAKYRQMYARSLSDADGFWGEHANRVDWVKPFTKVENTSFAKVRRFAGKKSFARRQPPWCRAAP